MGVYLKRCLFLLFFVSIMCLSIIWPEQLVNAEVTGALIVVSVDIASPVNQPANTSQIVLSWQAVLPASGGTIRYYIEKSINGGLTFAPMANVTALTWTDNNGVLGVPNYTNVIYRLRSVETVGTTTYDSPFSMPTT